MAAPMNELDAISARRIAEQKARFEELGLTQAKKELTQTLQADNAAKARSAKPKDKVPTEVRLAMMGLDEPRRSGRARAPVSYAPDEKAEGGDEKVAKGSTGAKKAPKQAKADKPKKAETETAEDGDSKRKGDRAGEKLLPKPHHKAKLPAHKDYPGWEQDFGFAWEKEKKEVPKSKYAPARALTLAAAQVASKRLNELGRVTSVPKVLKDSMVSSGFWCSLPTGWHKRYPDEEDRLKLLLCNEKFPEMEEGSELLLRGPHARTPYAPLTPKARDAAIEAAGKAGDAWAQGPWANLRAARAAAGVASRTTASGRRKPGSSISGGAAAGKQGLQGEGCDYTSTAARQRESDEGDVTKMMAWAYIRKRDGMSGGWRSFVVDHMLYPGDCVLLEQLNDPRLLSIWPWKKMTDFWRVHIFRVYDYEEAAAREAFIARGARKHVMCEGGQVYGAVQYGFKLNSSVVQETLAKERAFGCPDALAWPGELPSTVPGAGQQGPAAAPTRGRAGTSCSSRKNRKVAESGDDSSEGSESEGESDEEEEESGSEDGEGDVGEGGAGASGSEQGAAGGVAQSGGGTDMGYQGQQGGGAEVGGGGGQKEEEGGKGGGKKRQVQARKQPPQRDSKRQRHGAKSTAADPAVRPPAPSAAPPPAHVEPTRSSESGSDDGSEEGSEDDGPGPSTRPVKRTNTNTATKTRAPRSSRARRSTAPAAAAAVTAEAAAAPAPGAAPPRPVAAVAADRGVTFTLVVDGADGEAEAGQGEFEVGHVRRHIVLTTGLHLFLIKWRGCADHKGCEEDTWVAEVDLGSPPGQYVWGCEMGAQYVRQRDEWLRGEEEGVRAAYWSAVHAAVSTEAHAARPVPPLPRDLQHLYAS